MVRAKVKFTDQFSYIGAIFTGDPAGPGRGTNPEEEDPQIRDVSGTAFRLKDPPLIVNELWYSVGEDKPSAPLPGIYKIGAWVHTGTFGLSKNNYTGLPLPSPFQPLSTGETLPSMPSPIKWFGGSRERRMRASPFLVSSWERRRTEMPRTCTPKAASTGRDHRKPSAGRLRCWLRLCAHEQCVSTPGRRKHCLDRKRSIIREQRDNHRGHIRLPSRTLVDASAGCPVCVQSWRIPSAAGPRYHDDLEERSCGRRSHQDRFLGLGPKSQVYQIDVIAARLRRLKLR